MKLLRKVKKKLNLSKSLANFVLILKNGGKFMIGKELLNNITNFDDAEYIHIKFGLSPEYYLNIDVLIHNANKLINLNNEVYYKLNRRKITNGTYDNINIS